MAAAFAVRKGGHAIHIGRQGAAFVSAGDLLGRMRRAIAGCNHSDVVAGAHAAVRPMVSEKRRTVLARRGKWRFGSRKLVGQLEFLEAEVVRVDVPARSDGLPRAPDRLAVTENRVAGSDAAESDLVAGGNGVLSGERKLSNAELGSGREGHARHRDIVGRVQTDGGVFGGGKLGDFEEHGESELAGHRMTFFARKTRALIQSYRGRLPACRWMRLAGA